MASTKVTEPDIRNKMLAEILEALESGGALPPELRLDTGLPRIILPYLSEIDRSPLHILWTAGETKVSRWWLSVGHAPRLEDYCGEDYYGPKDRLHEKSTSPNDRWRCLYPARIPTT